MKPIQVFHPYQLHRDQLKIVRDHDLVCIGTPARGCLADPAMKIAFAVNIGHNRFTDKRPNPLFGALTDKIFFCSRAEAKRLRLECKPVQFARPRKVDFAAQIAALEEENKSLREKLAKINKMSGEV